MYILHILIILQMIIGRILRHPQDIHSLLICLELYYINGKWRLFRWASSKHETFTNNKFFFLLGQERILIDLIQERDFNNDSKYWKDNRAACKSWESPWAGTQQVIGTLVLHLQGTGFCHNLNELGSPFFLRASK